MSKKDLAYYLEHTDEMPTDPAEIERLTREAMDQTNGQASEDLTIDRIVPPADEPPKDPPKVEDPPKTETPKTEEPPKVDPKEPKGVLAKDGEHIIPYSQLEQARSNAREATEREQAALNKVNELNARIQELTAGKAPPAAAETTLMAEEELVALEATDPTLAKVLRGQVEHIHKLEERDARRTAEETRRAAAERREVNDEIQDAIDQVPKLAEWQASKDQAMWDRASATDAYLRQLPEWRNKSFKERFEKVVEITEEAIRTEPAKVEQPAQLTQEQIRAAAEAKLRETASKSTPKTLSDIPGGAPPAQSERERLEQMSVSEMGSKMMGFKSLDEIQAFLTQL